MEVDTGIRARGWHGEGYRGHIFWGELFIFPLLTAADAGPFCSAAIGVLMRRAGRPGEPVSPVQCTHDRAAATGAKKPLTLFYEFSAEELAELFGRLGYTFEPDTIPRTIDYYLRRSSPSLP